MNNKFYTTSSPTEVQVAAAAAAVPQKSQKVIQLAEQILALNLLEGKELSDLLKVKYLQHCVCLT